MSKKPQSRPHFPPTLEFYAATTDDDDDDDDDDDYNDSDGKKGRNIMKTNKGTENEGRKEKKKNNVC